MSERRVASKAGSWYPADEAALRAMLAKCLPTPAAAPAGEVIAGVAPHAGLAFSGSCAGQMFAALQASRPALRTVVILGAVHTQRLSEPAIWATGAWQTPLGDLPVDENLSQRLAANTPARVNHQPHDGDNAIELLIPFVKYLYPAAQIVPVAVPPHAVAVEFGQALYRELAAGEHLTDVAVLASTDLTHYGQPYNFAPAGGGAAGLAWARENDLALLELVKRLQAAAILQHAACSASACGAGALAAVSAYAAAAGCAGAELLAYTNSHEISGGGADFALLVGYAALIFALSPAAAGS